MQRQELQTISNEYITTQSDGEYQLTQTGAEIQAILDSYPVMDIILTKAQNDILNNAELIAELDTDVSNNTSDIAEIRDAFRDQVDRITQLEEAIDQLAMQVEELQERGGASIQLIDLRKV